MNWLKRLFTTTKKENNTERYTQRRLTRLDELKRWEASSPDTFSDIRNSPQLYKNWTDISDGQMPYWIKRIARRINEHSRTPIFIHRRFISYKINYDDYEGVLVFRGINPLKQRTGIHNKYR